MPKKAMNRMVYRLMDRPFSPRMDRVKASPLPHSSSSLLAGNSLWFFGQAQTVYPHSNGTGSNKDHFFALVL